jgi:hypothetical protein
MQRRGALALLRLRFTWVFRVNLVDGYPSTRLPSDIRRTHLGAINQIVVQHLHHQGVVERPAKTISSCSIPSRNSPSICSAR